VADTSITIGDKELLELLLASKSLHQSAIRLENELADLEERIGSLEKAQAEIITKLRTNPDSTLSLHAMSLKLSVLDGQLHQVVDSGKGVKMWLATVSSAVVVGLIMMLAQNLRWSSAATGKTALRQAKIEHLSGTPNVFFTEDPSSPWHNTKG
jgi:hypothetical protein